MNIQQHNIDLILAIVFAVALMLVIALAYLSCKAIANSKDIDSDDKDID
jgi:hypothetical protein